MRSLMLIGIGTVGLAAIVTLILNQVEASGVAYSLDMVLSLCVGGFANYMVNERH
ncbi:MAG TPA: hypothetical protein VFX45_12730 [Solirubrobacterales bacterium]|nr:hypothetical protein [Solirubrobacterales bacterium]